MISSPGMELLEKSIKAAALRDLAFGALTALVGAGIAAMSAPLALSGQYSHAALTGAMGLALLYWSWSLFKQGRAGRSPRTTRVYQELSGGAKNLGWAHLVVGSSSGVRVHFLDGDEITLAANRQESATLMALIQQRAPQAILGYSPELQQRYLVLLRRHREASGRG